MSKDQKIAARKIVDDMIEQSSHLIGDLEALRLLFPEILHNDDMQEWQNRLRIALMYPFGISMLKNISDNLTKEIGDG
jgi:hypothetical protein